MMYGEKCPACGLEFNTADDIVVCPICGTPHHRECWLQEGNCINEQKHAEGFVWMPASRGAENGAQADSAENGAQADSAENGAQDGEAQEAAEFGSEDADRKESVCPQCGNECPQNALTCPSCGALLGGGFFRGSTGTDGRSDDGFNEKMFMSGVDEAPDADIGGLRVGDASAYIRINAKRYIPKFMRAKNGKKIGWNWAALVFAPYWFFFRKMYKVGGVLLGIVIAVTLAMNIPLSNAMLGVDEVIKERYDFELSDQSTWTDLNEYYSYQSDLFITAANQKITGEGTLTARQTEIVEWYVLMISVNLGALLIIKIFSALVADDFYRKSVISGAKSLRRVSADRRTYRLLLLKRGGISVFAAFLSYYAPFLIVDLLSGLML